MGHNSYFEFRQVDPRDYAGYTVPAYLKKALGPEKGVRILDFGAGFGHLAQALRAEGYTNIEVLDVSPPALAHCRSIGLVVHDGNDPGFFEAHQGAYDFVILSHVVEHFPKAEIIPLLGRVASLLRTGGATIVMVPNAQSNTGAYWAYEDFTHHTLFTSGSLYYVLRAAGFSKVEFLDPAGLEGLAPHKRIIKRALLALYRANYKFWNRVTSSAVHAPSPLIFGYEVRALARK